MRANFPPGQSRGTAPFRPQPAGASAQPAGRPGGAPLRLAPAVVPLTCEQDPSKLRRAVLALGAFALALMLLAAALDTVRTGGSGLLGIGLGRIGHLLDEAGAPGTWLLALLEQLHFAGLCLWFAFTLWFGMSTRPRPLPFEQLYFHRRQSPWVHTRGLAIGLAGLAAGAWLAQLGIAGALLAALVEAAAMTFGTAAAWSILVPEARMAMSVVLDREEGFGNRILVSGGAFQRLGRRTIRHHMLDKVDAVAFLGPEAIADSRGLKIFYAEANRGATRLDVRGIAGRVEIDQLSDFLNTRFQRALHPAVFLYPASRQTGRHELIPGWRR